MSSADDSTVRQTLPAADGGGESRRFEISFTHYLNPDGQACGPLPEIATQAAELRRLYRMMVLTRSFDTKAIALQRTGQLGTYASSLGQEAIGAALGAVMRPEDVLVPSYREHAAQFLRGVTMTEILLYWGGDERGMDYQGPREDFPVSVPIATHVPHAAGIAYAMKLRRQPRVAVSVCGDGATSKGDFYEALNVAGVCALPVVFLVCNNQWAISVPRAAQSGAETLAQKAIAAGLPGEQVDGNDLIAMHERLQNALERARRGAGATLIEALTYRLSDHTTADDASRYRSQEEVEAAWKIEPIERLRRFLANRHGWGDGDEAALQSECSEEVDRAVKAYLATGTPPVEGMFDYLYEKLPAALTAQRDQLLAESEGDDDA